MPERTQWEYTDRLPRGLRDALGGRRVLVTGASGFLGSHLTRALAGLGADVHTACRADSHWEPAAHGSARHTTIELRERDEVERLVAVEQPAIVFHLAGMVDTREEPSLVMETFESNLHATVTLLEVLRENDCASRIVLIGSAEEISGDPAVPTSPYAASKIASSAYGLMYWNVFGLPVVVARPFTCYGPGQPRQKLIPYAVTSLLAGETAGFTSGRRVCDFIFVADVIAGLLHAGTPAVPDGGVFDVGTGTGTTIRDAMALIRDIVGRGELSFGELPEPLERPLQLADRSGVHRLPGWTPAWSLRDGLAETIDWYRSATSLGETA